MAPTFLPLAEAREKARLIAEDIFAQQTTLHDILERHEKVVRARWLKKTREKRKRVLLGA